MADLEELGFVASPHTSSGRVPTARGYRLFVDTLLKVRPVEQQQAQLIEGSLQTPTTAARRSRPQRNCCRSCRSSPAW